MAQEIIFTTLPHQKVETAEGQALKLSVFVSVKLQTPSDTTLNAFEDILNYPQRILDADFQFKLSNGTLLDAQLNNEPIDPVLYQNIFHGDIRVDDFKQEDISAKRIHSFPMKHIKDFVISNYKQIAIKSPTRLVTADRFVDESAFAAISTVKLDERELKKEDNPGRKNITLNAKTLVQRDLNGDDDFKRKIARDKFSKFSNQIDPKNDFVQLRQFHKVDRKIREGLSVQLKKPEFEFHDIMAVVNSYPQIMRKLGFVLDFTIPYNTSIPSTGTIQLVPKSLVFEEGKTTVSIPATAYTITNNGFYIGDKSKSIFKNGFVKINSDEFSVIQVDADGAALKTHGMTENKVHEVAKFYETRSLLSRSKVLKARELEVAPPPEEEGLPYMRSAGIAVIKNGMAEHLFKSISLNVALQQNFVQTSPKTLQLQRKVVPLNVAPTIQLKVKEPTTVLYSDEIIQGYRMDIAYEDQPETWYSLHQRQDEYSWYDSDNIGHPINGIVPDEGFIQLGMAEDPEDPDDVFVSETLARWEGWSLSVRKPGYAINESDDYELQDGETEKKDFVYKTKTLEAKKYTFDPDLEFKINAQSKIVPGTLPKLRFGKDYRVRIRAVDLAGNSVPVSHPTESPLDTIRANIRYLRYEPLASPIVLVGNELKDGEFLERMVVRSNFDRSVTDYESTFVVDGKKLNDYSQRFLLPPKNSQLMAENHSMFEKAFGNNPAAAQEIYTIITQHEELYQQDEKNKEKIYQPSDVEIIYLPDPMAAGVSLFVAEGYENTHTQEFNAKLFGFFTNKEISPNNTNVSIPENWYNAGHIRIRLEEGEMNTNWDPSKRIFTVYLPKGFRTRIKFSTFWREEDLKSLSAIWEMINEDAPNNLNELEKLATSGQHWMVSPSREMELVHAVQQPVDQPVINELIPERDFNTTFSELNTEFDVHGESTEKLELQSRWIDPLDDGISVKIKEKPGRGSIPDIMVNYHDDIITKGTIPNEEEKFEPKTDFKVQRQKVIQKRSIAQFETEPQPKAKRVNNLYISQASAFKVLKTSKIAARKNLVDRVKFDMEETKFSFFKAMNFRIKPLEHHFGDTKHRWVDYKLLASSRYREYFDKVLKAFPEQKPSREGEWVEKVNILSSARPKAPEIDYIIPTFEWRKTQNKDAIRHQRMGGGLRIFIKRPWFSSGADEKLAVVLPHKIAASNTLMMGMPSANYTPFFTHWGIDPLLASANPEGLSPKFQDFRMNPLIDSDLQYPDQKGLRAAVAAYPVQFDEERQIWFCDLAIDPQDMYFPFVKLALARYQEHSVKKGDEDVCLSPVVIANFTQLVPERQSTLVFKKDDQNSKFTLTIEGVLFNERLAKYGNYSFLKISFIDSRIAQPIYGLVDDGYNEKKLEDEGLEIKITTRDVKNNRYKIEREFRLPKAYKTSAFQIVIEEYERGPNKMPMEPGYQDRLEQSEETDRLIYADVFKINEVD